MRAIAAPGHTPGCTVFETTAVEDDQRYGQRYGVVIYGCVRPNDSVKLIGNADFPDLVDQTRATFRRMRTLSPDIVLHTHPDDELEPARGERPSAVRHPLADPDAWPTLLDKLEADFEARVSRAQADAVRR